MRAAKRLNGQESGYILATTTLLLIPLLLFAGLAVDVGGWTVQAARNQAAADAASLAAAPLVGNRSDAESVAREVAALNGFTDGVDGASVEVTFPSDLTVRVAVRTQADLYLSGIVLDESFGITRRADATAASPVGIGSPTNVLGFGPYSLDGSEPAGYWLQENNDCQPAHYGDYAAAKYLAWPWCGDDLGLPLNPFWKGASEGRDGGSFYVVEIPPGLSAPSRLMVLDPGACPGYGTMRESEGWRQGEATELEWRQWSTNGSPLVTYDDKPVTDWWGSEDCLTDLPYPARNWVDKTQGWTETPFVFPANSTGRTETYLIQSRVVNGSQKSVNYFSFWVRPDDGTTSCLTIGSDSCPTVGAESWISVAANGTAKGKPMDLYLARVGPENAGKTMEVVLWDAGEGMDNIQVIDPLGQSLDFAWDSDDVNHGVGNPSDSCSGNPCLWLDPESSDYRAKLNHLGWRRSWRFSGRFITLKVPLDGQVDFPSYAGSGNGYWFRVRFFPKSSKTASEWAGFSVRITGDPIRLTD